MSARDVEPTTGNVLRVFGRATPDVVEFGCRWYAEAHRVVAGLHDNIVRAAGVVSAYSPRSNWSINIANAEKALRTGIAHGGDGTGAMVSHARIAQRILDGEDWRTVLRGSKTRAFAELIELGGGDSDAVVIDRHAVSVAVGRTMRTVDIQGPWSAVWNLNLEGRSLYASIADCYREAARSVELKPYQMQAITWEQFRRERLIADVSVHTNGAGYVRGGSRSISYQGQFKLFDVGARV
jgi:hypothetical protein